MTPIDAKNATAALINATDELMGAWPALEASLKEQGFDDPEKTLEELREWTQQ